jgi:hypothetical protein
MKTALDTAELRPYTAFGVGTIITHPALAGAVKRFENDHTLLTIYLSSLDCEGLEKQKQMMLEHSVETPISLESESICLEDTIVIAFRYIILLLKPQSLVFFVSAHEYTIAKRIAHETQKIYTNTNYKIIMVDDGTSWFKVMYLRFKYLFCGSQR